MTQLIRGLALAPALLFLTWGAPARTEQPAVKPIAKPAPTKFLRIKRDDKKEPVALETATVRYAPEKGELVVDLIGVVHIGDRAYYQALNKQMEQYDVVLYELVAPADKKVPPKGGNRDREGMMAMVQQAAKLVLDLDLQLEQIDYTRKNFVHADLSPQEMAEAIKKRGDDGFTLFLGVVGDMMRQQNLRDMKGAKDPPKGADIDIASLLLDPDGPVKLKRMMAEQFETLDDPDGGLGKTVNQILIADRNKAAMKVLGQEIAKGKKKIAIFYGAAHMPDFEKRLGEDFGLKKQNDQWLQAWDLSAGRKRGIEDLLKKFLE
ncbi:MAG: hypothetical protein K2R98_06180 [Gemmataceae bacterium]|nr:hypothetical protein [Gemmataceae bacterium]